MRRDGGGGGSRVRTSDRERKGWRDVTEDKFDESSETPEKNGRNFFIVHHRSHSRIFFAPKELGRQSNE